MPPILEVKNLVTRFYTQDGVVHAVNGVSFELEEGETLAIVGESGCGKSVTMMSLLRLIPNPPARIEAGQAIFDDGFGARDLLGLPEPDLRQVRGGRIGFVFQDPLTSLNPVLTIGEQIAESLIEHLRMPEGPARERAVELLEHVGLPAARERYTNYPHQFSGGMRQRVMIAMAIACVPKILIADEPTTALDVTIQAQIVDLVTRLRGELGMAVIWITHDLGVVAGIADRVQVMYGGMVAERARVDDLYDCPQHPYTIGLLGALPRLDDTTNKRLVNIKGSPPDLLTAPAHCPFAARCPYAFERCWREVPALRPAGVGHHVACFFDVENGRPRDDG
ncbi:MAG: ABC transporter ATP-binding protein [Chloroflexi bacterium]|nr:ABC transporter ATP-binding protein [Chloroflexota bacterium]